MFCKVLSTDDDLKNTNVLELMIREVSEKKKNKTVTALVKYLAYGKLTGKSAQDALIQEAVFMIMENIDETSEWLIEQALKIEVPTKVKYGVFDDIKAKAQDENVELLTPGEWAAIPSKEIDLVEKVQVRADVSSIDRAVERLPQRDQGLIRIRFGRTGAELDDEPADEGIKPTR